MLAETQGSHGLRRAVLAALSKRGKAASVYWDVDDTVVLSCARKGKVLCQTDDPFDAEDLPRSLAKLAREAETRGIDDVLAALTMAVEFTGAAPAVDALLNQRPGRFAITAPVNDLPITPEELIGLEKPSPEVVRAVTGATDKQRRQLATWSARQAVAAAQLESLPGVISILKQVHTTGSARSTPAFERMSTEHDRSGKARDAMPPGERHDAAVFEHRLNHCALSALRYLLVADTTTAALGATEFAGRASALRQGLRRTTGNVAFFEEALSTLDSFDR